MKKSLILLACVSLIVSTAGDAWSATKKRKHGHRHKAGAHSIHKNTESLKPSASEAIASVATPSPSGWFDKFEVGWKKGLQFKNKDESFSLKIRNVIQARYEYDSNEQALDKNTFQIRRLKTSFEGNAFSKNLDYKIQFTWINSTLADILEDAYVDYKFNPAARLEAGQFAIPYNRQEMTSSGRQQFVDRSLAADEFRFTSIDTASTTTCTLPGGGTVTGSGVTCGAGATSTTTTTNTPRSFYYDTGLMLHGDFLDKKLEYAVAVTNGSGNTRVNGNKDFLYTGRLVWNAMGAYGYSEGDTENLEHPSLALAFDGGYNVRDTDETTFIQLGSDIGFKYKGFSLQGEYFFRNVDPLGPNNTTRDHGYYAQAGYFIIPQHFEVAARASQVILSGPSNNKAEYTLGLNYYMFGHDLKLQADYSYLPRQTAADTMHDQRFRLQLQAWF
ncbi:MAG: hypothetical protein HQM15_03525 [Deltaproteobacteria bacterium]|nr:hypothetical protein [Deltaproteobacteria bacterium]